MARPLAFEPGQDDPGRDAGLMKGARPLVVNGELNRGVTIVMANRELAALLAASRRLDPLRFKGRTAWTVRRLQEPRQPRT